jgi:hypothetical protein
MSPASSRKSTQQAAPGSVMAGDCHVRFVAERADHFKNEGILVMPNAEWKAKDADLTEAAILLHNYLIIDQKNKGTEVLELKIDELLSFFSQVRGWSVDYSGETLQTPHGVGFKVPRALRLFIERYFAEVHEIICNNKRKTEAARAAHRNLSPVAAGLATFVAQKLGVPDPIAFGVGTFIILMCLEASRGAFCSITKEMWIEHFKDDFRGPRLF